MVVDVTFACFEYVLHCKTIFKCANNACMCGIINEISREYQDLIEQNQNLSNAPFLRQATLLEPVDQQLVILNCPEHAYAEIVITIVAWLLVCVCTYV
jgi:hypothetical protein